MLEDTYLLEGGNAIQAFDRNVVIRSLHGFAVEDGAAITLNTGTLGDGGDAVSLASGSVIIDRSTHTISSQSVDLPAADDLPKWVVVGIDDTGSITVRSGTPEAAQIDGESTDATRRDVHKPVPPSIDSGDPLTALALIWIPENADSIDSEDIFDVRVPANIHVGNIVLPDDGEVDGVDLSAHVGDADAHHAQTHDNTDHTETYTVGDYEIQVDGSDGDGIINFVTQ